ncbi:MAG: hypothetical protein PHI87_06520 [Candidatus Methanomethylophilus sp.]|nr:hypothetical protein [Methanomethylophilus sp.]
MNKFLKMKVTTLDMAGFSLQKGDAFEVVEETLDEYVIVGELGIPYWATKYGEGITYDIIEG